MCVMGLCPMPRRTRHFMSRTLLAEVCEELGCFAPQAPEERYMSNAYRLNVTPVSRKGKYGNNAIKASAYISRDTLTDYVNSPSGVKRYRYREQHQGEVESKGILVPERAPAWMKDKGDERLLRQVLWNEAEMAEKRSDAQIAIRVIMSLPKELTAKQRKALVEDYINSEIVPQGRAADYAIHTPHTGNDNYHAHILMTSRGIDDEGFKRNKLDTRGQWTEQDIHERRAECCKIINEHLIEAGLEPSWDHRTREEQYAQALTDRNYELAATLKGPPVHYKRSRDFDHENSKNIETTPANKKEQSRWSSEIEKIKEVYERAGTLMHFDKDSGEVYTLSQFNDELNKFKTKSKEALATGDKQLIAEQHERIKYFKDRLMQEYMNDRSKAELVQAEMQHRKEAEEQQILLTSGTVLSSLELARINGEMVQNTNWSTKLARALSDDRELAELVRTHRLIPDLQALGLSELDTDLQRGFKKIELEQNKPQLKQEQVRQKSKSRSRDDDDLSY